MFSGNKMWSNFLIVTIISSVIISTTYAKSVKFTDCGSKNGKILQIIVTPCDAEPCTMVRGSMVSVQVQFQSFIKSNNATMAAGVDIAGQIIPVKIPQPDACQELKCPLMPDGTLYTAVGIMKVPANVPLVPFAFPMQATLTGDDKVNILCGQVKLKLK